MQYIKLEYYSCYFKDNYYFDPASYKRTVKQIEIKKAFVNNLKGISLKIPHNKIIVVTGVSGSGKSSLAMDLIFKESQRRFLESFSTYTRRFIKNHDRPDVLEITGLKPAISVSQKAGSSNPRSTVGTLSGIYDLLRLFYARFGETHAEINLSRSLFSFNTPAGCCPQCKGLGVEDYFHTEDLISDGNLTIREGAFRMTTPNHYIMYSQVTMDVLNDVCNAHGFSVDIPWNQLSQEQKNVVLFGSEKIKVPFGKHTLESRLKWTGITAKPREEGYYKGIIPVMENILKVDRNVNILKYSRLKVCHSCNGARVSTNALNVLFNNLNIFDLSNLSVSELLRTLSTSKAYQSETHQSIIRKIISQLSILENLSLGYLSLSKSSDSLSGSETQRVRLANQVVSGINGISYIFDEPALGLHQSEIRNLLAVLRNLRDNGNTVIVVEHNPDLIVHADWIIDIGPEAGAKGGEVLFNGPFSEFYKSDPEISRTSSALIENPIKQNVEKTTSEKISVIVNDGEYYSDLVLEIHKGRINTLRGKSGVGKRTVLFDAVIPFFSRESKNNTSGINKIHLVESKPIGKTPRSIPATYTGLYDEIRKLYSSLPLSKNLGFNSSSFSFNTKGGRCETCEGAGKIQLGMQHLGSVDLLCPSCNGKRFSEKILTVEYKNHSISQVLDLSVNEAILLFADNPKINAHLSMMNSLGLGYMKLGQSSTTLSGGEAQRIRLATELVKKTTEKSLYILIYPSSGLHIHDIDVLFVALHKLAEQGHTLLLIDNNREVLKNSNHATELIYNSETGKTEISYKGPATELYNQIPASDLLDSANRATPEDSYLQPISFTEINTNNLKNISIEIPRNKITAITGVSGSGKSSLAFDTIYIESKYRFAENLSPYIRSHLPGSKKPDFSEATGTIPAVVINQQKGLFSNRSTVGTYTDVYDNYRMLFSRFGEAQCPQCNTKVAAFCPDCSFRVMDGFPASIFSFNNQEGACSYCNGLGSITTCDSSALISQPHLPINNGAMDDSKTGTFYGDPYGQHMAILQSVGNKYGFNPFVPYSELSESVKKIILYGCGDEIFDVIWNFKRKDRTGSQHLKKPWLGLIHYVNEEYDRKHADKRGVEMMGIMMEECCSHCNGSRLNEIPLSVTIGGKNIYELSQLSASKSHSFIHHNLLSHEMFKGADRIVREIVSKLDVMKGLGLSHLSIDRNIKTLSGGEMQRLKLANAIGNEICGVLYVLDEPSAGLHGSDIKGITHYLERLIQNENTILMVEHNPVLLQQADVLIELGPGAGKNGGSVIFKGTPDEIISSDKSITGPYLRHKPEIQKVQKSNPEKGYIRIKGAKANNLKDCDINIPLGQLTAITGVSGSGKSSLLEEVLYPGLFSGKNKNCVSISSDSAYSEVIFIDQRQSYLSSNSIPATYLGIYDQIRSLFSKTKTAKEKGHKAADFSMFGKTGTCSTCSGQGQLKIKMDLLADEIMICESCNGKRFKEEILTHKLNHKDISEILELTFEEAEAFFMEHKNIATLCKSMIDLGMGYIQIGQPMSTLSAGEAQRIRLAKMMISNEKGRQIIILDEPTRGLHFRDIENLLRVIELLVKKGNTVVASEHNLQFISNADWVIDLGPEGGENGGEVVAFGTPFEIVEKSDSATALFLKAT